MGRAYLYTTQKHCNQIASDRRDAAREQRSALCDRGALRAWSSSVPAFHELVRLLKFIAILLSSESRSIDSRNRIKTFVTCDRIVSCMGTVLCAASHFAGPFGAEEELRGSKTVGISSAHHVQEKPLALEKDRYLMM